MENTLILTRPLSERIVVPFTLGVFEDCTLILQRTENGTWEGAVEYPERISIHYEYPYIIPAEVVEQTPRRTTLLVYSSSDMVGGFYNDEPTNKLLITVKMLDEQTVHIILIQDEQPY